MARAQATSRSIRWPLLAVVLAAGIGLLLIALREPSGSRGAASTPAASGVGRPSDPGANLSGNVGGESEPARAEGVDAGRPAAGPLAAADLGRAPDRGLRGRLVGADGEPFAGARVTVELDAAGVELEEPAARAESDELGRFELGIEGPLGEGTWSAVARAPGRASVSWRIPRPPGAAEWIELGSAVLVGGGALVVRPVDESGAEVSEPVEVYARASGKGPGGGSSWRMVSGATSPGRPAVRLEGLPPGRHTVGAAVPALGLEAEGLAVVREGETVELDLPILGIGLEEALVVRAELGVFSALSASTSVELLNGAGDPLPEVNSFLRTDNLAQIVRFDGLTAIEYRARVRAPGFREVELRGLRPGERHAVELEGSVELQLEVLDPAGLPVDAYAADLFCFGDSGRSEPARLATLDAPDVDGRFEGVPALPAELTVRDARGASAVVELDGLRPDQVAFERVQLRSPAALVVEVVEQGTGAPLAGRTVSVKRVLGESDRLRADARREPAGAGRDRCGWALRGARRASGAPAD